MANNLWNNYTQKDTPVDNDELMIYDSEGKNNKKLLFGGFWKWIAKKLKEAELADLQTADKTVVGAINYLYGNKISSERFSVLHIYYKDSKVIELGGLDACIKDALNNTIPKDGTFYGTFVANIQYLMFGYRYVNGAYGVIILFDFNNNTERWNINNNKITKV